MIQDKDLCTGVQCRNEESVTGQGEKKLDSDAVATEAPANSAGCSGDEYSRMSQWGQGGQASVPPH